MTGHPTSIGSSDESSISCSVATWHTTDRLDPEERVEVALAEGCVAADRAGVDTSERGEHHAAGVELDVASAATSISPGS